MPRTAAHLNRGGPAEPKTCCGSRSYRCKVDCAVRDTKCKKCGQPKPEYHCKPCLSKYGREWHAANRERNRVLYQKRHLALRLEAFAAYGGACACCGESQHEFMSIDHIHGGGNKHRKEIGKGGVFLRWLRAHGYPKDRFRLLCHNCNQARGYRGYCPHELARAEPIAFVYPV